MRASLQSPPFVHGFRGPLTGADAAFVRCRSQAFLLFVLWGVDRSLVPYLRLLIEMPEGPADLMAGRPVVGTNKITAPDSCGLVRIVSAISVVEPTKTKRLCLERAGPCLLCLRVLARVSV